MTRVRTCVAAAAAVALLGGSLLMAGRPATEAVPPIAAAPASGPASTDTTTPRPTEETPSVPEAVGPPAGTLATPEPYLARYRARRVSWAGILSRGRPLPRPDARCKASWRKSGKDGRLAWGGAGFWCLDGLPGEAWKPQGVAGSGTTKGYTIGDRAATSRNIVLTSWYSRRSEKGLFAANRAGESVTRLVVIDLDRKRYSIVELVRPEGKNRLRSLNSHGSGLAWAGQYLYSSSQSWLWMYNADDLLEIKGHYVLPAVARWSVSGAGSLSSISLDRTSGRDQLVAINYSKTAPTRVHAFDLTRSGTLPDRAGNKTRSLALTTRFGEKRRVIRSVSWRAMSGEHYQGVGRWGRYTFANSSSLRIDADGPRSDAMVVLQNSAALRLFRLPGGNVESVYLDYHRRRYVSLTEDDSQFLFVLPVGEIVSKARR